MKVRIEFESGDWVAIDNIVGIVAKGSYVAVNLSLSSRIDSSYDVPEVEELSDELRKSYKDVASIIVS